MYTLIRPDVLASTCEHANNTEVNWFTALFTRCKTHSIQPGSISLHHPPMPWRANCPWTVGMLEHLQGSQNSHKERPKSSVQKGKKCLKRFYHWLMNVPAKGQSTTSRSQAGLFDDHGLSVSYKTLIPSIKIKLFKQFTTVFSLLFKLSCSEDWTILIKGLRWEKVDCHTMVAGSILWPHHE